MLFNVVYIVCWSSVPSKSMNLSECVSVCTKWTISIFFRITAVLRSRLLGPNTFPTHILSSSSVFTSLAPVRLLRDTSLSHIPLLSLCLAVVVVVDCVTILHRSIFHHVRLNLRLLVFLFFGLVCFILVAPVIVHFLLRHRMKIKNAFVWCVCQSNQHCPTLQVTYLSTVLLCCMCIFRFILQLVCILLITFFQTFQMWQTDKKCLGIF